MIAQQPIILLLLKAKATSNTDQWMSSEELVTFRKTYLRHAIKSYSCALIWQTDSHPENLIEEIAQRIYSLFFSV